MLLFISCNTSPKDHPEQMAAIFKIVNALPDDNTRQIYALDSAFSFIKNPGPEDRLDVYAFKCSFYQRQHDFANAFKYADSMLDLTENKINQTKYAKWYASALASKGDIYMALKNYDESFICYTKSRVIAESVSTDTCGTRKNYTQRLADLMYKQKKFDVAAACFKRAIQEINCSTVTNEFLTFVYTQANYDNVGLCYSRLNEWDSAAFYFNTALKYIVEQEPKFPARKDYIQTAKAVVWGNLAGYYVQKNDVVQAESLYVKSIAVFGNRNDKFAQNLQIELADLLTSQRRFAEASHLLQLVNDSLQTLPDENNRLKYYRTVAGYHLKLGETTSSAEYLKKYIAYKDSVDEANERFTSIDIGTDMEKRYQQALNENLRKDNQLKQLYLIVAVLTAVVIIILLSFLMYNFKRQSKHRRELALQGERERISKELHDDLGSGLTSLQIMIRRIMSRTQENADDETLHNIANVSEELTDQMSEVVWMLNNANDTVNGLLAHLRLYMAAYLEKTGLDMALEFNNACQENYTVSNLLRRNLILVIKEVFNNTIKHAGATRFFLQALCEERKLKIILQDNGSGLPANLSKGNGLENIQSRINNLNGSVIFKNENGLQVVIEVLV